MMHDPIPKFNSQTPFYIQSGSAVLKPKSHSFHTNKVCLFVKREAVCLKVLLLSLALVLVSLQPLQPRLQLPIWNPWSCNIWVCLTRRSHILFWICFCRQIVWLIFNSKYFELKCCISANINQSNRKSFKLWKNGKNFIKIRVDLADIWSLENSKWGVSISATSVSMQAAASGFF